jgi:hypothetical protein
MAEHKAITKSLAQAREHRMGKALSWLVAAIASGREYPDAHTAAILRFCVDGDALRDAYDAHCLSRSDAGHPDNVIL